MDGRRSTSGGLQNPAYRSTRPPYPARWLGVRADLLVLVGVVGRRRSTLVVLGRPGDALIIGSHLVHPRVRLLAAVGPVRHRPPLAGADGARGAAPGGSSYVDGRWRPGRWSARLARVDGRGCGPRGRSAPLLLKSWTGGGDDGGGSRGPDQDGGTKICLIPWARQGGREPLRTTHGLGPE
jgi:hypothetical protein